MKYTDVVTMINGHTAATVNGRRLVFTPEQWKEIQRTKIVMLTDSAATVSVCGNEVTVIAEEWQHVPGYWRDTEIRRIAEYKYNYGDA